MFLLQIYEAKDIAENIDGIKNDPARLKIKIENRKK